MTAAAGRSRNTVAAALLDEYAVVIADLKAHIADVTPAELAALADGVTTNRDCVSIAAVLTHVVHCGDNYLALMRTDRGDTDVPRPKRVRCASSAEYAAALDRVVAETDAFLRPISNARMARHDPARKLRAGWGQLFDWEQLMEHAIVHVSRHRRQIVRFKAGLRQQTRGRNSNAR